MYYEDNYDYSWLNLKVLGVFFIIVLIGIIIFAPLFHQEPKPIFIDKNESTAIQIEYVTVLVTPTPDGKLYFAPEYENGIRKMNRPFSFIRENALGKQDLVIHAELYDYKEFNTYHWFNPMDYKYYTEYPSDKNNKFMFVFFSIYSDMNMGDDTRFWVPNQSQFILEGNNNVYMPLDIPKQLRFAELEDTYNYNGDYMVSAYNTKRVHKESREYADTAGETVEELGILKGGKSNAIDGYIIYEIPKSLKPKDITFWVNFYSWGNAGWKLEI